MRNVRAFAFAGLGAGCVALGILVSTRQEYCRSGSVDDAFRLLDMPATNAAGSPLDRRSQLVLTDMVLYSADNTFSISLVVGSVENTVRVFKRRIPEGEEVKSLVNLPMDLTGGFDYLKLDNLPVFVFSGAIASSATGIIALIEEVDDSYRVTDTYLAPGRDFTGIAYSPMRKRLYVVDAERGHVLQAPYPELGCLPSVWSALVTESDLPALADIAGYQLFVSHESAEGTELRLWAHPFNRGTDRSYQIHLDPLGTVTDIETIPR